MAPEDTAILTKHLGDPVWRLTSGKVYKIKTADGRGIVPFHPRPEQTELLIELLAAVEASKSTSRILSEQGEEAALAQMQLDAVQKVKLKARRLGFSTTIGVFVADCLGFRANFTAQLIDQIADDATRKMNDIVKVAMEALMEIWPLQKDKWNDSQLTVSLAAVEDGVDPAPSTFYAGTRGRGGSCNFLWASELGVIQFDDVPRADEIVSGAFPSARWGVKFVETTWKGGRGGKLWDIIEPTLEGRSNDWSVSFCPWWKDPRNVSNAELDADTFAYFLKADVRLKHEFGVVLTDGQKRWWAQENRTQGIYMKRENPTFLDECWEAPVKGVIWAEAIAKARNEGRITNVPHDPNLEVDTFWDLGAPDNTSIKFVQHRGGFRHLIASQSGGWTEMPDLVRSLKARGYKYHAHFIPHDGAQTARMGATFEKAFREELARQECGGKVIVLERAGSIWPGVNHMTSMFNRMLIDKSCTAFVKAAEAYRRRPDPRDPDSFQDEVVKDWTTHECLDFQSLIDTQRGKVPIGEMTSDDKVLLGGILADVEWVGPTRIAECLELTFDDGSILIGSHAHKSFSETGLARLDSLSIGSALWTPRHLLFTRLTDSPLGARGAFIALSKEMTIFSGRTGKCTSEKWMASKCFFTAIYSLCAILPPLKNGKSYAWEIGKILAQKIGLAAREILDKLPASDPESTHSLILMGGATAKSQQAIIATKFDKSDFTGPCGNSIMAPLQTGCKCITKTMTKKTMSLATSNYCQRTSILVTTAKRTLGSLAAKAARFCAAKMRKQKHGMPLQKAGHGIRPILKHLGCAVKWLWSHALTVGKSMKPRCQNGAFFAHPDANRPVFVKTVVAIRRLPPRQLYDMTVTDHHAYVANGVLVSNCDSIRYLAEADMAGYLPTSGDAVAIRPYFDPGSLKAASVHSASNLPRVFNLVGSDGAGRAVRHVTATPDPGGWMRMWLEPKAGFRHVVTLIGRSLQVWRSDCIDGPMMLAAAPPWIQQPDHSLFYLWAAQMSAYYGLAPIALDVVSHPGGVHQLRALGAPILARTQIEGKRPLGQEEPTQHAGWEWKPEVAQHALVLLQGRIRTMNVILNCPSLIAHLGEFQNSADGRPEARDGIAVDLANGAALAALCHDHAGLYRAPVGAEHGGHGIDGGRGASESSRMRRR